MAYRHPVAQSRQFDAVVLDAGGVLLLPDPAILRAGFERVGVAPDDEAIRRAHYASMRELDRIRRVDWTAVDRVFAAEAGIAEADFATVLPVIEDVYLRQPFVPIDGVVEGLQAVADAGFALAIVSNASGSVAEHLATHRICAADGSAGVKVEVVVDSAIVGIEKPDPRIFDFALDALGVPADRSLYVGDTVYFDVDGARAAGMPVVHVDPYGFCPDRDHPHTVGVPDLARLLVATGGIGDRSIS